MKTRAAVLYGINQPLRVEELTLPFLQPGQVLVQIAYSGVCHSQLLEVRGKRGTDRFLPHTLGHEGAGWVIEVGERAGKVKRGDPVVLSWIKGSGMEVPRVVYEGAQGPVNSGAISTFMDYAIVAENRLTRIPGAMPLREAALLGCAVPTGGGIVWNTAKIQPGQAIAVFGAGGVGLSAIMAAKAMNAGMIMAIDLFDHKLEYAKRMGATHTIHGLREKPVETIRALTGGRGVDYAVEAAGTRETMEAAFQSVCDKGGLCILAGNLPRGEGITLDPFDLIMGKKIIGTWGGESRPDQDIPLWADQYLLGKLPLREMITHTYRLEDINQALEDLEKGRVGRALIDLGNRHEDFHRDRDREGRR